MHQNRLKLSSEEMMAIRKICAKYNNDKGELINVLSDVQDYVGYLPKHAQKFVAVLLKVSEDKIGGLVAFYSFFRSYPQGKHIIRVCQGRSCSIKNGAEVLEAFKNELNLAPGQTSEDGKITLLASGCMGACGLGPVTMIDDETYPRNNPEKVKNIVTDFLKD